MAILNTLATFTAVPAALLAEAPAGGGLMGLLPIALMFGVIYFVVLRPMSKQEKDRKKRVDGLNKGDKIVLAGGILGRISSTDEKIAVVEIADKVKIRVLKKDIVDSQENALKDDGDSKDSKDKKDAKTDGKDAKSAS